MTAAEIARVPEVVTQFDGVLDEEKKGGPGVVFVNRLNGTTYYVSAGPNKNGRLLAKTMWKKPTRPQSVTPGGMPPPTSTTLPGTVASSNPSVPSAGAEVKRKG